MLKSVLALMVDMMVDKRNNNGQKYVKKPIPVEAVQFNGHNIDEVNDFCQDAFVEDGWLCVSALEGIMKASNKVGDYVVKDAMGKFYICEKGIFEEMYEEADDRSYVCSSTFY